MCQHLLVYSEKYFFGGVVTGYNCQNPLFGCREPGNMAPPDRHVSIEAPKGLAAVVPDSGEPSGGLSFQGKPGSIG